MSTRGFRQHLAHVEALCDVEVEWTGRDDAKVRSAWKAYMHHLNKPGIPQDITNPLNVAWCAELDDLFAKLIVALGDSIGKPQDATDVKTGAYGPKSWWEYEQETSLLRKGLLAIMARTNAQAIPVSVVYDQLVQEQVSNIAAQPKPATTPARLEAKAGE